MTADDRAVGRPAARWVRHPSLPLVVLSTAAVVTLIATFMPWLDSGSTRRSSYDLLGTLDRLDIAPDGLVSTLVRWWPVVPLLVTLAVVSAWWGWTRVAVGAAAVAAVYAGGVGLVLVLAARRTGIDVAGGAWLCTLGSAVMLGAAVWLAISATRRGRRGRPSAPPADRS